MVENKIDYDMVCKESYNITNTIKQHGTMTLFATNIDAATKHLETNNSWHGLFYKKSFIQDINIVMRAKVYDYSSMQQHLKATRPTSCLSE